MSQTRGQLIGRRYVLDEKLGEGGMGAVFRASDHLTRRTVALKRVVIQNTRSVEVRTLRLALAQEFRILASLRHPNIISVLDYGFEGGSPYFTMDFLDGARSLLEAGEGKPLGEQIHLVIEVLQSLAYLHRHGILHRDLKPANVMVDKQEQVKVLDFGLSVARDRVTSGDTAGTLAYLAPEVVQGQPASEASDLYAVGLLAYQLIMGRHPFEADNPGELISQLLESDPDLTPIEQIDRYIVTTQMLPRVEIVPDPDEPEYDIVRIVPAAPVAPKKVIDLDATLVRGGTPAAEQQTLKHIDLSGLVADPSNEGIPSAPSSKRGDVLDITGEQQRPDQRSSLTQTLRRLMAKSPRDRYADAYAVIHDLSAAINQPVEEENASIRESYLQSARFVGRDRELQTLTNALFDVVKLKGALWLVAGESGVGKSRMMEELRIRALVEGALVMRGQAIAEVSVPYRLWSEPLRQLALTTTISDAEGAILKSSIPDLETLVGRALPDPPTLSAQARHERFVEIIVDLFRRQTLPTVVLLEDLQWTEESLVPLQQLSTMITDLPVMIVATYRDDERPNLPASLPAANVLKLDRLSTLGLAELSVSILGSEGSQPQLLKLLSQETEGNTYFVIETLRELAQTAGNLRKIGKMNLPVEVFAGGVRQVLQHRLARVPEADRPLLTVAALFGRQLNLRLLRAVSGQPNLDEWLNHCMEAAVLQVDTSTADTGRWTFAHDKLREAITVELTATEERGLHRQIAEGLVTCYGSDPAHIASVGTHWYLAGEWERAVPPLLAAGNAAAQLFANADARLLYSRAMECLTNLPDTEENRRQRINILLDYDEVSFLHVPMEQSLARLDEADALAAALSEEGDTKQRLIARINLMRGRTHSLQPNGMGIAIGYFMKVYEIADAIGDSELIIVPSTVIGSILTVQGYFNRALPMLSRSITRPDMLYWTIGMTYTGIALVLHGEYRAALKHGETFLEAVSTMNNVEFTAQAHTTMHLIYLLGGDYEQAIQSAQQALEYAEKTHDIILLITVNRGLAWASWRKGDWALAQAHQAQAQEFTQQMGGDVPLGNWFALGQIETHLWGGNRAGAIERAEALIAQANAADSPLPAGIANRMLAQALEDPEKAAEHLTEARVEEARTRVVFGDLLAASGDQNGARTHWQAAADTFEAGGFAYDLADVRKRLAGN
jgi:serine/threonine protein kinase/tetratricopeptide (TPR) repeat protein